jgi:pimeloyl-ACP methyl ester carboxylesterase
LQRATIIGHDWGGTIGWWTAILSPARVERLAVLSVPHPACYVTAKEKGDIYNPPDYVAQIVTAPPGAPFDAARIDEWASHPVVREELAKAIRQLDIECLRNFYRASEAVRSEQLTKLPPLTIPVLVMYGKHDRFVGPDAYEKSAAHVTGPFRLVPVPGAEHYPHKEAAPLVNLELERWLDSC